MVVINPCAKKCIMLENDAKNYFLLLFTVVLLARARLRDVGSVNERLKY